MRNVLWRLSPWRVVFGARCRAFWRFNALALYAARLIVEPFMLAAKSLLLGAQAFNP